VRVLYKDPKGHKLKLFVDTPDDLWHLYNVIGRGDRVGALSARREETGRDKLRQERGEKRKMWLEIDVEEVEFSEFSDRLRVSGPIREGPQDLGSYHTLNIETGIELSISKEEWQDHQIDIVREAISATTRPLLTFVAIDDEEATLATLHHHGVKWVADIPAHVSGKDYETRGGGTDNYFGDVLAMLAQVKKDGPVVICGSGFTRDAFVRFGRERRPELFENYHSEGTGQSGMTGIYEMMKRDIVSRVISESRVGQETAQVEELLSEIAKDGKCAYGMNEVRGALEQGAVVMLLVTDELMRKGQAEKLFRMAKRTNAKYMIISTAHEAGKKLSHLGGAGALLRYKLQTV
jgi:protein pelota